MRKQCVSCYNALAIGLMLLVAISCKQQAANSLFSPLPARSSGIDFINEVHENDSTRSFINEFGYMGGGVGIGDFNNDGLKDIFFTGNQVSCRLYLNTGANHFNDITKQAGLTTEDWATGVSIVDINHDGFDDIYLSVFGKNLLRRAKNRLFINQHNLTFRESAAEYGLADTGYSTQAVFFDYDKDGDLDMYLANYLLNGPTSANYVFPRDNSGRSPANDRLYRNNGYDAQAGHDVFSDISMQAGIKEDGYGLGVVVSDFNNDSWPDIYVANDFISNDALWLNNQQGGFTNCISKAVKHQSYSAMGADAADLNNDALPDIVTLDMAPEYNDRKKKTFFFMNYDRYQAERSNGYQPSFPRNMLQLNIGTKDSVPLFSETGQLAGISETDWSWSVLLADFNNDGFKDMHITNGIGRDFINGDFLEYSSSVFAGAQTPEQQRKAVRTKLASLAPVTLGNYLYLNNHDNTFSDASAEAGINAPSLSNGAAYADLDNDGDLDIVVNNINQPAFVLINNSRRVDSLSHFIKIRLQGDSLNTRGFGTKIKLYAKGGLQWQEQNPVRGYFSSVDPDIIFGIGRHRSIDSIVVTWPDNRQQVLRTIAADTTLVVQWKQSALQASPLAIAALPLLEDLTAAAGFSFVHHDNLFNDFNTQRLLPQKFSQMGPFLSTADMNGDGITDFFIGNGFNFSGKLVTQNRQGVFASRNITDSIKMEEDMATVFFDADGDGDQDLLVTSGDVLYEADAAWYRPRLYINDGIGNFSLDALAIPAGVATIAGCVTAGDYDEDGDLDIFIGGRVSKTYPVSPNSYLLQNNRGVFTDVTAIVCPALQKAGMVSAAVWVDIDNDRRPELVLAGEWMPVRFFKNNQSKLNETTAAAGLSNMNGMWRSLVAADIDNDGDTDLVAGNLGLNCVYKASAATPMQLMAADIDGNGTIDPVLFYCIKDRDGVRRSYPAIGRNQLAEQVPSVKKKFLQFDAYAQAGADDIFTGTAKENMLLFTCTETRSCWLENRGNGQFEKHLLPMEAQFAPLNAIIATDLDHDGFKDLVLAGNEYQTEVMTGRYDASYGLVLKGSSNKTFTALPASTSGFMVNGDVKSMALLPAAKGGQWLLAAVNNDSLRVFRIRQ
jgi:enediyne biosynthesis protein E4